MADQHNAATVVEVPEVGAPGVADVAIRDGSVRPADLASDRRKRQLPVHGREHSAVLGVPGGLVERDRPLLGVDPQVGKGCLLVTDSRIDVEAVDFGIRRRLHVVDAQSLPRRRHPSRGQARCARVRAQARPAQPDRLGRSRACDAREHGQGADTEQGCEQASEEGDSPSVTRSRARGDGLDAPRVGSESVFSPP